jgi:hypothetical protein
MRLIVLVLALFAPIDMISALPQGEGACFTPHWATPPDGGDQTEFCDGTIN